jgi:uncharacterized membrane protein YjdF
MDDPSDRASTPPPGRYLWVACAASLALVAISLVPHGGVAKYHYSFLFLVPMLCGTFLLRRRLLLRPLHFALFAVALLLHDLGAFGGYQRELYGVEYDWLVHGFFGFVGGLVLANLLDLRLGLRGPLLLLTVVLLVTGVGGLHEIVEAGTTKVLGEELGMLRIGPGNPFDTQSDLASNVVGSVVAFAVHAISRGVRSRH